MAKNIFQNTRHYDEFTLAETETGTETEIDKIDTVPIKAHLYYSKSENESNVASIGLIWNPIYCLH